MRTDIAFDKLCDIAPIISDIVDKAVEDPELIGNLKKVKDAKKKSDYLRYFAPVLKVCKHEVFEILAIVGDKTVEEIEAQDLKETLSQAYKLLTDKEFTSFFSSSVENAEANTASEESSTTCENTAEEVEIPISLETVVKDVELPKVTYDTETAETAETIVYAPHVSTSRIV